MIKFDITHNFKINLQFKLKNNLCLQSESLKIKIK